MRLFFATLALAGAIGSAHAHERAVTPVFVKTTLDDRYFVAWGGMGAEVADAVRCAPAARQCRRARVHRHHVRRRPAARRKAPLPRTRPSAIAASRSSGSPAVSLAKGLTRELDRAWPAPMRFIRGRLICALNVNAALAERGIHGTGSALAKSFLHWGHPSRPVPGAVAIFNRGRDRRLGHVAIVARVERGRVTLWNPSPRGWRLIVYRRPAIAYRGAG